MDLAPGLSLSTMPTDLLLTASKATRQFPENVRAAENREGQKEAISPASRSHNGDHEI